MLIPVKVYQVRSSKLNIYFLSHKWCEDEKKEKTGFYTIYMDWFELQRTRKKLKLKKNLR